MKANGRMGKWGNGRTKGPRSPILPFPHSAILFVLLLVAGCRPAASPTTPTPQGPLRLTATLSTNVVFVGDPIRLTLVADHSAASELRVPDLARGKEIIVRGQKTGSQKLRGGLLRTTVTYDLTSLVLGRHSVSTGVVESAAADGTPARQAFPALEFEVRTSLAATDQALRPGKGVVRWPAAFPRWVIGMLLAAVLSVAAGFLVARFLQKPRTILRYPPAPPPHEVALQALRDLLAKGWIESGQLEPFYVELSGIVRTYLENRFGLRAPERTTEEFIREAVESRLLRPEHQLLTRDFLEQCDLVKFARHRPAQAEMRAAYAAAERLVTETMPPPPSPQEARP